MYVCMYVCNGVQKIHRNLVVLYTHTYTCNIYVFSPPLLNSSIYKAFITPHTHVRAGVYVIGTVVHTKIESYFSDRLTFSNIHSKDFSSNR